MLMLLGIAPLAALELHVAPAGDDANPGTKQQPFATMAAGRDAIRKLKQTAPLTEPVTVIVHSGTYFLPQALNYTSADSGTEHAPITYLAERGSAVHLTGGRIVASWRVVSAPDVLERLTAEARGQVRVADLRAQGITDFGKLALRGFARGYPVAEAELFCNDEPMTLARWPNDGFRTATDKTDDQTVMVDTDRMTRWSAEIEPWVMAYWHHDWAELYEPLVGFDPARKALLRDANIKPVFGLTPANTRWYVTNVLAELDSPGEYYIDRPKGLLYFWPPQPDCVTALSMTESLIRADNLAYVTFRNLTVEQCRGTAISFNNCNGCKVEGCIIRNTGQLGVSVSGGTHQEVRGCDIFFTGTGGISMSGGDRATLTPANHNAENNHVHHFARRARTYHPAITVSGVGNRIAHNLVHDGPHMALAAGGNDHVVEFNEIHNVVEESGDAGAYYVGRDWTQRGNILRYNYWHDILGPSSYGGMTIYLDDQHSGYTIHGNLFERCMQSVFIGGGDDNTVTNNVFLDCWKAAHLDNRGMGWQKPATDDPEGELRSRLNAMPYTNELWKSRYPTLVEILSDAPGVPKRNVFAKNLSAGGKWDDIAAAIRQFQTVSDNLAFDTDSEWIRIVRDAAGRLERLEYADPPAVKALGFQDLPVARMGLVADETRASWPVSNLTRKVKLPEK